MRPRDDGRPLRPLALDQRVERSDGPKHVEDRLLLVQVQLGEPPQRVAAEGEAAAERHAVDRSVRSALIHA